MTEWFIVFVLKINMFIHRGFKSHCFLMLLQYNILFFSIEFFITLDNTYYFLILNNSFYSYNYAITDLILDFLPEILISFGIIYDLINIFNDKKINVLQYYK